MEILPIFYDIIILIWKSGVRHTKKKLCALKNTLPKRARNEWNEWEKHLSVDLWSTDIIRILLNWHNWLRHWIGKTWPKMSDVNRFACKSIRALDDCGVNLISRRQNRKKRMKEKNGRQTSDTYRNGSNNSGNNNKNWMCHVAVVCIFSVSAALPSIGCAIAVAASMSSSMSKNGNRGRIIIIMSSLCSIDAASVSIPLKTTTTSSFRPAQRLYHIFLHRLFCSPACQPACLRLGRRYSAPALFKANI